MNPFNYKRRLTSETRVGKVVIGGDNPIRIQSMTNTNTNDTDGSAEQVIRIVQAGADLVRLTAQGVREAENLRNIKAKLHESGYNTPLVADIHFNPRAAEAAAKIVEKVRVNPGNFVDRVKSFEHLEYSDEEYAQEIEKIRSKLVPLLNICKEHGTALRIGVNHGSLSDRIMSRFGDTPEGMVESCMEFLHICVEENFKDIVISIKASNTIVMTKTVRLLTDRMEKEDLAFPFHLGVTEAGDAEDGRIKSAVGIGSLLADGIGETIRVSLSEDPEREIPVAKKLVEYIMQRQNHEPITATASPKFSPYSTDRRKTYVVENIGGDQVPVVISDRSAGNFELDAHFLPDYIYAGASIPENAPRAIPLIVDVEGWTGLKKTYPLFSNHLSVNELIVEIENNQASIKFIRTSFSDLNEKFLHFLKQRSDLVLILTSNHLNAVGEQKAFFHKLLDAETETPVIVEHQYGEDEREDLQIKSGADFGAIFLDGFGNGISLRNSGTIALTAIDAYMFGILQASRLRTSKTEFISCPSCGRTLFDLQTTVAHIKKSTSHLKNLKIGVMGCIVNGPGEMADADYGYVGAEKGKVSLYKKKECIEKNIPSEQAVDHLIKLIKDNGDWLEPET
ncbi:MAG: 4-hydroxy-3-methylbut-2-en-1-yl diphosphate synthase [Bacteroidales bacterium 45-6]|nr:MAG: 4-hydroxy-3-methylbut-2-en-1-yl diphosphate synthase [Bacteroidales bacterium 45-6]